MHSSYHIMGFLIHISILMHTSQFDTLLFQYQKETESLHIIEIYV